MAHICRRQPAPTMKAQRPLTLGSWPVGLIGALVLFIHATAWAQSPADSLETFTAPDGAFTFQYSSQLIHCQQQNQEDGGASSRASAENCGAYFPVCDEDIVEGQTSIACFAYPRNQFTNTPAFEAATFSVEIVGSLATERACLSGPPDADSLPRHSTIAIHGISLKGFGFSDAGMNQGVSGEVYRTFHRGKCYQLGINVATANAQTFEPPVKEFAAHDRHEVHRLLQQARDSFRFLR